LLWAVILILLLVLVIGWFADPFGKEVEQGATTEPTQTSTDWAEQPTDAAVDVTLPDTTMTNAPAEPAGEASPAASPAG